MARFAPRQKPLRDRPNVPPAGTRLCALGDIADPGAKGFVFGKAMERFEMVVVRRGETVHGYINECPHALTTLETFPDRFLNRAGTELICTTHGARFRAGDGLCVHGPCEGLSLRPVPVRIENGDVVIADAEAD